MAKGGISPTMELESPTFNHEETKLRVGTRLSISRKIFEKATLQVSRRKLLIMVRYKDPEDENLFFNRIMRDTNTSIKWPNLESIELTKEAYVNITIEGCSADIMIVKEIIFQFLSSGHQDCKIHMRLGLRRDDYWHIFECEKLEKQNCRFLLPTNLRNSWIQISGELQQLEEARTHIRNLSVLSFLFEIPTSIADHWTGAYIGPYMLMVYEKHNVRVSLSDGSEFSTKVTVEGSENQSSDIKKATILLLNHMKMKSDIKIKIQTSMLIDQEHQKLVFADDNSNLEEIMKFTGTQITVDHKVECSPNQESCKLKISGSIDNVHLARQHVLGFLPVTCDISLPTHFVGFLPTAYRTSIEKKISHLMEKLDVEIECGEYEKKKGVISVKIRGIERSLGNIYEAIRQLVGPNDPQYSVHANIPNSYHIENNGNEFQERGDNDLKDRTIDIKPQVTFEELSIKREN